MSFSPISERVILLDVIRGIAIFGMFTVNMTADVFWSDDFAELPTDSLDFAALVLVNLFTNGKFITLFSFLFGIGFFVQTQRRLEADLGAHSFWLRRLAGLLFIGITANALTVPAGILIDYSFFGLGLLLFMRASRQRVLLAAAGCFVIAKFWIVIVPELWPGLVASLDWQSPLHATIHENQSEVVRDGAFLEVSRLRLLHIWVQMSNPGYFLADLDLLGLMLFGLYVGKAGAVRDREKQVQLARRMMPWLLSIGFTGCALWVAMNNFKVGNESWVYYGIVSNTLAWPVGMPVLGLGYAALITLMIDRPGFQKFVLPFAPVGRMALTNYLFTGFTLAVISFEWGFGLYGEVYPAAGLLITVVLLPLQMLGSRLWLNHFRFGPAEWIWRTLTYGNLPSMRRRDGRIPSGD